MAVKTFYLKDAVPAGATLHRSLQDGGSAPTAATTGTGWISNSNVLGQSCLMVGGTEVARNAATWGTTLQPSAAPSATLGDCWRSENAITGDFANSNWVCTFGFRSVTAAYTGRLKLAMRLYRSTNASGAGATEITAGRVVSVATAANLSTSADTTLTCTFSPGAIKSLSAEYLFMQVGIEITSAGSGTTQDFDFRVGSTYTLVTPGFTFAQTLTPALFSSGTNAFYAATVAPGAVSLTPGLFTSSSNAFYAATVSGAGGDQSLTPTLFTSGTNAFYTPTVAPGAVALTPVLFSSGSNAFYAATLAPGAVTLLPGLVTSATNAFYAGTVAPGAVTLLPGLLSNSPAFYSPTVAPGAVTLLPALFTSASNAIFAATVSNGGGGAQSLTPALYSNASAFHAATVTPGAVTLAPALFSNSPGFYAPTVSTSYTLSPALLASAAAFFAPAVSPGAVSIAPALLVNVNDFALPDVVPGTVTLTQDSTDAAWNIFYAALVRNVVTLVSVPEYSSTAIARSYAAISLARRVSDASSRTLNTTADSRTLTTDAKTRNYEATS